MHIILIHESAIFFGITYLILGCIIIRMVPGNFQEDGERDPRGVMLSGAPSVSGQLVSTNGSVGSASRQSEAGMATPARDYTALKLSHLEIHGDDSASQGAAM